MNNITYPNLHFTSLHNYKFYVIILSSWLVLSYVILEVFMLHVKQNMFTLEQATKALEME